MRAIAALPQVVRRVVVCTAPRRRITSDGIEILPVARFLEAVADGTPWP